MSYLVTTVADMFQEIYTNGQPFNVWQYYGYGFDAQGNFYLGFEKAVLEEYLVVYDDTSIESKWLSQGYDGIIASAFAESSEVGEGPSNYGYLASSIPYGANIIGKDPLGNDIILVNNSDDSIDDLLFEDYETVQSPEISGGGQTYIFAPGMGVTVLNTDSNWDLIGGDNGTVDVYDAQTSLVGGGNTINFIGGSSEAVSLYATDGNWDVTDGSPQTIYLTSAQASVFGGGNLVYFSGGSGNAVSLYDTAGTWDLIGGSNGVVYLTNAQASLVGGGDTVYFDESDDAVSLYDTSGDWDAIGGANGQIYLTNAKASVVGGGNKITFIGNSGNAVSLYKTSGGADAVNGANGTIYMTGARASIIGAYDTVWLAGGSAATMGSGHETFAFDAAIGQEIISGFTTSDTLQFSKSDFADYQALSDHVSQSGANTVISLDQTDIVTLTGVTASSLTASNFRAV